MARRITWTTADGATTLDLTDRPAGYRILGEGTSGLTSPPYRLVADQYAGIDGATVQNITADAREVVLGLMVQAFDAETLAARLHTVVRAMRPKAGIGTLTVTDETGVARSLSCYYTSGLEGSEARGAKLPGLWVKAAVHLYAPDPWWYGPAQTISAGLGAPTTFFPILPMRLSSSTVQGSFTVDLSDSDSPAFPIWTITGPGSTLILTNETTGRSLQVNATLVGGETMIIDTRPGVQSIRRGDGTNMLSSLASDPALWPLVEGVNHATALFTDATAASRIVGQYQLRYASA